MNDTKLTGVFCKLMAGIFLLYLLSFYIPPIKPKTVFYLGLMPLGLLWLLWRPIALGDWLKAFGIFLLPLAAIQLLNIHGMDDIKLWLYMAVFLTCCVMVERSTWGAERVYSVFAWCGVLVLCYSTVDWLWIWHQSGQWIRYENLFGRSVDPINTSVFIASGLAFLWLTTFEPKLKQHSTLALFAGLVVLSGLVLLAALVFQSRTALLGFGLFMVAYIVMRRMWGLGLLALIAIAVIGYLAGADQILSQRGLSYRPQIWADAWHRIIDTCGIWFGCGNDGYGFRAEQYRFTHPHNLPLGILYSDGVVGLALIGIFVVAYVRGGIRLKTPWFLISLIGIGAQLTNMSWLLTSPKAYWIYFWVPILLAFIQIQREKVDRYFAARQHTGNAA
ncbi:MAG: O-antigen ligase family protein [Methylobacillus sp.]|nr:O-antigen ligase family protein [Methylobacillus sp.]